MIFSSQNEFSVAAFSREFIAGVRFRRRSGIVRIVRVCREKVDPADPAAAWRTVLKPLGRGRDCPLYLTGSLDGGLFFQHESIELPPRAMRDALELELPQHLPQLPEKHEFQFTTGSPDPEGNVPVNVYVFPAGSLGRLAAMLTQSDCRADSYVYPLLALIPGDPPIELSRLDPDFAFAAGVWSPRSGNGNPEWPKRLEQEFKLPVDGSFRVDDYLECLLVARLVTSPGFGKQEKGIQVLPRELRPRRFRNQLRITALLIVLIAANALWGFSGAWSENYRIYRTLNEERETLERENLTLRSRQKKQEKELKELNRIVTLKAGENGVIPFLAEFTRLLPSNVMASSLRWGESSIDLILQSEAENLDLPPLLNRLTGWKISQLQQRRFGSTVSIITLKLVPEDEEAGK